MILPGAKRAMDTQAELRLGRRRRVAGGLPLPDFLIIGAMKGGTTSLARYLGAHPDVFMAACKEVHYFDRQPERDLEWYAGHFEEGAGAPAIGEATPNYLYLEEAVERLASTLPDARLVAILRNPVDRAYSHYWHERSRGRETLAFEEAIEAENRRLSIATLEERTHCSYIDQGRYLRQLRNVTDQFPREQLLVLLSEDLRDDPAGTVGAVCKFLGVDERVPDNVGTSYNRHISFRSLRVRAIARRLAAGGPAGRLLGRIIGRLNTRRIRYAPMSRELRDRLLGMYAADNEALAGWLERDLSRWNG